MNKFIKMENIENSAILLDNFKSIICHLLQSIFFCFSLDSDDRVVSCSQDGEVVEEGAHSDVADAILHVQLVHPERFQRRHVQFRDSWNANRDNVRCEGKESANTPAGSLFITRRAGFKVAWCSNYAIGQVQPLLYICGEQCVSECYVILAARSQRESRKNGYSVKVKVSLALSDAYWRIFRPPNGRHSQRECADYDMSPRVVSPCVSNATRPHF